MSLFNILQELGSKVLWTEHFILRSSGEIRRLLEDRARQLWTAITALEFVMKKEVSRG